MCVHSITDIKHSLFINITNYYQYIYLCVCLIKRANVRINSYLIFLCYHNTKNNTLF